MFEVHAVLCPSDPLGFGRVQEPLVERKQSSSWHPPLLPPEVVAAEAGSRTDGNVAAEASRLRSVL